MFGLHGAQFERLAEAGMDNEQVYILRQILTNPDLELEHSGKVTFHGKVSGQSMSTTRWAKCIYDWDYDKTLPSLGGGHGFVLARECETRNGNRLMGGLITIYLPAPPAHDPNAVKDNIITF